MPNLILCTRKIEKLKKKRKRKGKRSPSLSLSVPILSRTYTGKYINVGTCIPSLPYRNQVNRVYFTAKKRKQKTPQSSYAIVMQSRPNPRVPSSIPFKKQKNRWKKKQNENSNAPIKKSVLCLVGLTKFQKKVPTKNAHSNIISPLSRSRQDGTHHPSEFTSLPASP